MPTHDRPLSDAQERALIALSEMSALGSIGPENQGWHRANEVKCSIVKGSYFVAPTWYGLHHLGFVQCYESSQRPLEVRITDAGRELLRGMGD